MGERMRNKGFSILMGLVITGSLLVIINQTFLPFVFVSVIVAAVFTGKLDARDDENYVGWGGE